MDTPQDDNINKSQDNETDIAKLKQERDEYLNGWKRAKADLINSQKDEQKRFQEFLQYANESSVRELIPVLDSLDLALASISDESAKKGIIMIRSQMEEVLKRQGLERIPVSPGDALDVNVHEPIGEQEPESEEQKSLTGKVASELVAGYKMNNKVIRPARVKIYK